MSEVFAPERPEMKTAASAPETQALAKCQVIGMIVLKSYIRKKKRKKERKARLGAAGRVLDLHAASVNVGKEGN